MILCDGSGFGGSVADLDSMIECPGCDACNNVLIIESTQKAQKEDSTIKRNFKYTGIYHDESYTFESPKWYGEVDMDLKYDKLGNLSIEGHYEYNERKSYAFKYDGIDIRIWYWNPQSTNVITGVYGTTGYELNVFKYLPKYVREHIQSVYQNLKSDNQFYKKLSFILDSQRNSEWEEGE